jgi:hypothetical protein
MAYHHAELPDNSTILGDADAEFQDCLDGNPNLPFWDYGLVLPDILRLAMDGLPGYRYAIVRSN